MRTLLLTICLLTIVVCAHAADVTLTWDPNTETDLVGYRLYQKQDSAVPPFTRVQEIPKGTQTATVQNLDGTHSYSLAVTAYNTAGLESAYSNVVTIPAAPIAPAGLKWALTLTMTGGQ